MARILLVVPNLGGHRQIYTSVISEWALKEGYSVVIATLENEENISVKAPLIHEIRKRIGIELVFIPHLSKANTTLPPRGFLAQATANLEKSIRPNWTVLPNADMYRDSFYGLGEMTQETGLRRAAIMNNSLCFYPVQYFQLRARRGFKGIIRLLRHSIMYLTNIQRERNLYLKDSFVQLGLDKILTMDNRFYSYAKKDSRFRYIPEIYRIWGLSLPGEITLVNSLLKEYNAFLDKNAGKDILLFFGGWAARRGYDTLMKLAYENTNCVFVGVGCSSACNDYKYDLSSFRRKLNNEGRIFEKDVGFISNNDFVDSLFNSAKYVILPYRGFFLSSGALITAASYGKPVLVPAGGNMADQVKRFGIGLTYRYADYSSLLRNFWILQHTHENYINDCRQFANKYSMECVFKALSQALLSR